MPPCGTGETDRLTDTAHTQPREALGTRKPSSVHVGSKPQAPTLSKFSQATRTKTKALKDYEKIFVALG